MIEHTKEMISTSEISHAFTHYEQAKGYLYRDPLPSNPPHKIFLVGAVYT